jgi:hypothetical protein
VVMENPKIVFNHYSKGKFLSFQEKQHGDC